MKKTTIGFVMMVILMAPMTTNAFTMSASDRASKLQQIDLLIAQLQLLRTLILGGETSQSDSTILANSNLSITYEDTYTMPGSSGAGFTNGESFIVQELVLQNRSGNSIEFSASDLRLRDSEGTVFYPIHESAVKEQPRYQNTLSGLPTSNPDTRDVTVYSDEELPIAVTFYISKAPADSNYSIRYDGGNPLSLTVDN